MYSSIILWIRDIDLYIIFYIHFSCTPSVSISNNQYIIIKLHYSATLLKLFCALKLFKKFQGQHNNIRYHIINLYYITPTTGLLS